MAAYHQWRKILVPRGININDGVVNARYQQQNHGSFLSWQLSSENGNMVTSETT